MKFESVDSVLDFAIEKEQDAADFYNDLSGKVKGSMVEVFKDFAKEEMGHKSKLISVKNGKRLLSSENKIVDLKIGDHLADIDTTGEIDYQRALIIAMKAEKNAYRLYTELAGVVEDADMKDLFLGLAQEEAKHKLRFEIEYDDKILTEN